MFAEDLSPINEISNMIMIQTSPVRSNAIHRLDSWSLTNLESIKILEHGNRKRNAR